MDKPRTKAALLRMSATDLDDSATKQRRRRQLKSLHKKHKEEHVDKQSASYKAKKLDEELRADKRVVLAGDEGGKKRQQRDESHSKSTAFFGKLQEQVASGNKRQKVEVKHDNSTSFKL